MLKISKFGCGVFLALATVGVARATEPTHPGQALNERNRLAIVDPVQIHVPPALKRKQVRALPGGDSVIVMVTIAVNAEGDVVDAEGHPPSITRFGSGVAKDVQELLTEEQIRRFREAGRRAALRSRFRPREHADMPAGELVRAQASFIWRVDSAPIGLHRYSRGRRDGDVVLTRMTSRYENPVLWLLQPRGLSREHRATFDPDAPVSDLAERGIPVDRLLPDDSTECGLRRSLPHDLVKSDGRWVSPPVLIRESKVAAEPQYPDDARVLRIRGKVALEGWIDKEGVVRAVTATKATPGFPSFVEAAVDAACRWRYEPARRDEDGAPLDSRFTTFVEFKLH